MPKGSGLSSIKIDFSKVANMTLGELYGTDPVAVTQLTKKLWELIKEKELRIKNK